MADRERMVATAIVPAEPGWKVVNPLRDMDGNVFELFDDTPVVAWYVKVAIDTCDDNKEILRVMPVTIGTWRWGGSDPALRDPGGRFYILDLLDPVTKQDVIKFFQKKIDED